MHDKNSPDEPRPVGFSFILPLDLNSSVGSKTIPITGFKHKPIGQIRSKFIFNPYLTNGFSHHYQLDESTFIFRAVRSNFEFLFHIFL